MSSCPWKAPSLSPPLDNEHDDDIDFWIMVITNTLIVEMVSITLREEEGEEVEPGQDSMFFPASRRGRVGPAERDGCDGFFRMASLFFMLNWNTDTCFKILWISMVHLPGKSDKAENMNLEWSLERRGGSCWWRGRRRKRWCWSGRPKAPGSSQASSRLPSPTTSVRKYDGPTRPPSWWWDTGAQAPSGRRGSLIPPALRSRPRGRSGQLASTE